MMPEKPRKPYVYHSMPKIKLNVKTPPSSGGMMDWGPLFGWVKSLFTKKPKKMTPYC